MKSVYEMKVRLISADKEVKVRLRSQTGKENQTKIRLERKFRLRMKRNSD